MYLFFRVYLQLTRLVGLNNLGYNTEKTNKRAFSLHFKPAFVYCMVLNAAYIALMPHIFAVISKEYYTNTQKSLLIPIVRFISCIAVLSFLITLASAWSRRVTFCRLLNQYARIFRKYSKQIFEATALLPTRTKTKRLLIMKTVASCCRLIVFYIHLYYKLIHSPDISYVLSTLYAGLLETILILVDCNIFLGLLVSNMLLSIYLEQLRSLRRDVGLLHELERKPLANRVANKQTHAAWRMQLCFELRVLMLRQRRQQGLIQTLLNIYQWQLLLGLFSAFGRLIVMLFRALVYLDDRQNFHIGFFCFYLLIAAANICNMQLLFDVCERILQHFHDMRYLLTRMLMQCGNGAGGGAEMLLQRSIEWFLLELQQHDTHLNVCGLFNLNRHTGHQVNCAIVGHLMVLVQLAIKQW